MQKTDPFSGITAFVAAAQNGSFTTAADKLGMTKSAISRRIGQLENSLSVTLFQRGNRKIALTPAGERYLARCLEALAVLDDAEQDIQDAQTTLTGRLRIDLPAAFGRLRVMPLLSDIMTQHPQLRMSVSFRERYINPAEEAVDLVVRIGELTDSTQLVARRLTTQKLVLCAAPAYLRQYDEPQDAAQLAEHRCIVGFRQDQPFYWPLCENGKITRIMPPPFYELADGDAMLSAALAGQGIAQLPLWMVRPSLASGALCRILTAYEGAEIPINLLWLKTRQLPARTRYAADQLIAAAQRGAFD